jgi:hypothetical protein
MDQKGGNLIIAGPSRGCGALPPDINFELQH